MKTIVKLLPLLVIYVLIVVNYNAHQPQLRLDENRYAAAAQNLTRMDSLAIDRVEVWSGPGYPMLLVPFATLKLPWIMARLLNAALVFLAVMYFHRTLGMYVGRRAAYVGAYALGLYPPLLDVLPRLMTEPATVFLTCGFIFHFATACRKAGGFVPHLLLASLYLGCLALTKVLFGYVIVVCLAVFLVRLVWKRLRVDLKSVAVCGLAILVCTPYLSFTHRLTGKTFYWSNAGGLSLYWMSTPYEKEYGDWLAPTKSWLRPAEGSDRVGRGDKHREFLDRVDKLPWSQRDDSLRVEGIRNIRSHPGKFLENWLANLGRLFFDYPFSYRSQAGSTYLSMLPGMFLVVALALSVYPAVVGRRRVPYEIFGMGLFALTYLAGSSVLSGYNRMLLPALPALVLWIAFTFTNLVNVTTVQAPSSARGETG